MDRQAYVNIHRGPYGVIGMPVAGTVEEALELAVQLAQDPRYPTENTPAGLALPSPLRVKPRRVCAIRVVERVEEQYCSMTRGDNGFVGWAAPSGGGEDEFPLFIVGVLRGDTRQIVDCTSLDEAQSVASAVMEDPDAFGDTSGLPVSHVTIVGRVDYEFARFLGGTTGELLRADYPVVTSEGAVGLVRHSQYCRAAMGIATRAAESPVATLAVRERALRMKMLNQEIAQEVSQLPAQLVRLARLTPGE